MDVSNRIGYHSRRKEEDKGRSRMRWGSWGGDDKKAADKKTQRNLVTLLGCVVLKIQLLAAFVSHFLKNHIYRSIESEAALQL